MEPLMKEANGFGDSKMPCPIGAIKGFEHCLPQYPGDGHHLSSPVAGYFHALCSTSSLTCKASNFAHSPLVAVELPPPHPKAISVRTPPTAAPVVDPRPVHVVPSTLLCPSLAFPAHNTGTYLKYRNIRRGHQR